MAETPPPFDRQLFYASPYMFFAGKIDLERKRENTKIVFKNINLEEEGENKKIVFKNTNLKEEGENTERVSLRSVHCVAVVGIRVLWPEDYRIDFIFG